MRPLDMDQIEVINGFGEPEADPVAISRILQMQSAPLSSGAAIHCVTVACEGSPSCMRNGTEFSWSAMEPFSPNALSASRSFDAALAVASSASALGPAPSAAASRRRCIFFSSSAIAAGSVGTAIFFRIGQNPAADEINFESEDRILICSELRPAPPLQIPLQTAG